MSSFELDFNHLPPSDLDMIKEIAKKKGEPLELFSTELVSHLLRYSYPDAIQESDIVKLVCKLNYAELWDNISLDLFFKRLENELVSEPLIKVLKKILKYDH
jgi:hypothetical protein